MHAVDTMFSVRERPWHYAMTQDVTTILPTYPADWDDARMASGLMWEPKKVDLAGVPFILPGGVELPEGHEVVPGTEDSDGSRVVFERVTGFQQVQRDDTNARLGIVKADMPLISHAQMGELVESFTEAWRKAGADVQIETMGSLKGGAAVWALVRLDEPFQIPGDDSATYPYAALTNSHDGTGSCKFMPTNVRIVCWNTFSAADLSADASGHQVIIRHVGDVNTRIEQAKETLAKIRDNVNEWKTVATELAEINVSDTLVQTFLQDFIPLPDGATERMRNSRTQRQAMFTKMYETSPTAVPGTAYGLLNTAGEWLDHLRKSNGPETYMTRTVLRPELAKGRALGKIRELVAAGT
jgi:phage/plasmid-like protein (TIGR03299 family)